MVIKSLKSSDNMENGSPFGLYIDYDCVEEFDYIEDAYQAYLVACEEYPDSVIDVLSADGETSYYGIN